MKAKLELEAAELPDIFKTHENFFDLDFKSLSSERFPCFSLAFMIQSQWWSRNVTHWKLNYWSLTLFSFQAPESGPLSHEFRGYGWRLREMPSGWEGWCLRKPILHSRTEHTSFSGGCWGAHKNTGDRERYWGRGEQCKWEDPKAGKLGNVSPWRYKQ